MPIKVLRPRSDDPRFTPMSATFQILQETDAGWTGYPMVILPGDKDSTYFLSRDTWEDVTPAEPLVKP